MISLQISGNDATRAVQLVATTADESVSFYRRIGMAQEELIADQVLVVDGTAVYLDETPPEKTLLSYVAISSGLERSVIAATVMPSTWQLTRPVLTGDIRLGDLILNTIDSDGTVWTVADIDGWWTLPEAQIPQTSRSREEDGSYDNNGRYIARSLTLTGVFLPKSSDTLEAARARLAARLDAVRQTVSLRVDETPPKQMFVRLSGKTSIQTVRYSGLSQFAVELTAADPVKYSVDPIERPVEDGDDRAVIIQGIGTTNGGRTYPREYSSTGGLRSYGTVGSPNQIRAYNYGTYPTPPHIKIMGPVSGPRIELIETGQFMQFDTTLGQGESLDVDVHDKTVIYNGVASRRGTMTFASEWFRLLPGVNTLIYTGQSSIDNTTSITVTAYSAWLG